MKVTRQTTVLVRMGTLASGQVCLHPTKGLVLMMVRRSGPLVPLDKLGKDVLVVDQETGKLMQYPTDTMVELLDKAELTI